MQAQCHAAAWVGLVAVSEIVDYSQHCVAEVVREAATDSAVAVHLMMAQASLKAAFVDSKSDSHCFLW